MKIAVINGSPKGKYSITLQTVFYLQRKYPEHEFQILNAGQKIKSLEKDFSEAAQLLESADVVLFSYPVYTFLAPSQLHRFIELTKANGVDLRGSWRLRSPLPSTSMTLLPISTCGNAVVQ